MLKLHKLTIEGFGSITHPIIYDLDGNFGSIKIIKGRNGSGKTTILNALCWVLYGKPIKKGCSISTWEKLNWKKGTRVELVLKDDITGSNYWIARGDGYKGSASFNKEEKLKSRLVIYKNEELCHYLRDKKDQQRFIEHNILNYSFDLFKNSIIFGQKAKRMVEEDGPTKKKIWEEAFSIDYLGKAKEITEKRITKNNQLLQELISKEEVLLSKITLVEEQLVQLKKVEKEFSINREKEIVETNKKLTTQREKINTLKSRVLDLKSEGTQEKYYRVEKELARVDKLRNMDYKKTIFGLEMEIKGISHTIEKKIVKKKEFQLALMKAHICNSCGNNLPNNKADEQRKKLNREIEDIREEIKSLENKSKALTEELSQAESKQSSKEKLDKEYNSLQKQKNILQEALEVVANVEEQIANDIGYLRGLENNLKALQKSEAPKVSKEKAIQQLKEFQQGVLALEKPKKQLQKKIKVDNWITKIALSNSGIKSYIFDNLLKIANTELKKFYPILGFKVFIVVDLDSKKKDIQILIEKDDQLINYADLSGGQQQLVNSAIAFSTNAVVSTERPCNILILDEVFESLDPENIEIVTSLIQEVSKTRIVHVITHQTGFNPPNSRITQLKLSSSGATKLVA